MKNITDCPDWWKEKGSIKWERWRPIPGIPFYEASNKCRIRSISREVRHNYGGKCIKKGRIISQYVNNNGYLGCGVAVNGQTKTTTAHRLIALAWIPNPNMKPTVNHINGNKFDNRISKLEWATQAEQVQHAYKIGLSGNSPRTYAQRTCGMEAAKKPVIAIDFITGKKMHFNSITECAEKLRVTQSCVSQSLLRGNKVQRRYEIKHAA